MAKTEPMAALAINIGASRPPDVPEPSDMANTDRLLNTITASRAPSSIFALRMSEIVS